MSDMFGDYSEMKSRTIEALKAPRVGDRFSEMFAFYVYVVDINPYNVTTVEASAPCELPKDGVVKTMTHPEFYNRFVNSADPWVLLVDRDNDVSGWLPELARLNSLVTTP